MTVAGSHYVFDATALPNAAPWGAAGWLNTQASFIIDSGGVTIGTPDTQNTSIYGTVLTGDTVKVKIKIADLMAGYGRTRFCGLVVANGVDAGKGYLLESNGPIIRIVHRTEPLGGFGSGLYSMSDLTGAADGDELELWYTRSTGLLSVYHNNLLHGSTTDITYQSADLSGMIGGQESAARRFSLIGIDGIPASSPSVNPTGTDVALTVGTPAEIVMQSMGGATATALTLRYTTGETIVNTVQADFDYTADDVDTGTISFTTTIGNLPYGSTGYQYIITLSAGDPVISSVTSLDPATGRSFVTAVDPVNDITSIISAWNSSVAVTGDQIDYPTAEATIREDFTHFYTGKTSESPPLIYEIGYWDSVTQTRYIVEITVNFSEGGVEPPVITNFRQLSIGFGIGFGI